MRILWPLLFLRRVVELTFYCTYPALSGVSSEGAESLKSVQKVETEFKLR